MQNNTRLSPFEYFRSFFEDASLRSGSFRQESSAAVLQKSEESDLCAGRVVSAGAPPVVLPPRRTELPVVAGTKDDDNSISMSVSKDNGRMQDLVDDTIEYVKKRCKGTLKQEYFERIVRHLEEMVEHNLDKKSQDTEPLPKKKSKTSSKKEIPRPDFEFGNVHDNQDPLDSDLLQAPSTPLKATKTKTKTKTVTEEKAPDTPVIVPSFAVPDADSSKSKDKEVTPFEEDKPSSKPWTTGITRDLSFEDEEPTKKKKKDTSVFDFQAQTSDSSSKDAPFSLSFDIPNKIQEAVVIPFTFGSDSSQKEDSTTKTTESKEDTPTTAPQEPVFKFNFNALGNTSTSETDKDKDKQVSVTELPSDNAKKDDKTLFSFSGFGSNTQQSTETKDDSKGTFAFEFPSSKPKETAEDTTKFTQSTTFSLGQNISNADSSEPGIVSNGFIAPDTSKNVTLQPFTFGTNNSVSAEPAVPAKPSQEQNPSLSIINSLTSIDVTKPQSSTLNSMFTSSSSNSVISFQSVAAAPSQSFMGGIAPLQQPQAVMPSAVQFMQPSPQSIPPIGQPQGLLPSFSMPNTIAPSLGSFPQQDNNQFSGIMTAATTHHRKKPPRR